MASDIKVFPVTIISTDITVLHELSWSLSSFGYQVTTFSDWSKYDRWKQSNNSSVLLLDARDEEQFQSLVALRRSSPFVYHIAIHDLIALDNSDQLVGSGADGFIHYPVNTGELITQLKSGFRRLEFERRLKSVMILDQQSGISTRIGFCRQLERINRDGANAKQRTLVVMGIDYLDLIYSQHGSHAAQVAIKTISQYIHKQLSDQEIFGILQEGVFSVLLPDTTVNEGIKFAKGISETIAGQNTSCQDNSNLLSVSATVLNWESGVSASDLIERGLTAYGHIKYSGGNLILEAQEVERDFSDWKQKTDRSSLSHEVLARHVMQALPLVLPSNGFASTDEHNLGIYAFDSTSSLPPCIPVVDIKGNLLGVVEKKSIRQQGSDILCTPEEHILPAPTVVPSNLSFSELVDAMELEQEDYMIVVENKKPIGCITPENLDILASEAIIEQVDSQQIPIEHGMSSLVIPIG